ncbi:hypothetical protein PGB90_008115 [Kerria lacca]
MAADKKFTLADVQETSNPNKPLLVIDNVVYDVTTFMNEHPGGEEVLQEQQGKDATEAFEDVGHSGDAREMMQKYKIGELADSDRQIPFNARKEKPKFEVSETDTSSSWTAWIIPAALAIAATVIYKFLFAK